ncbi:MAG: major capsid protein [Microvirus sp.]|nr:MAG: major capsid protein [Microvirus sp.]
MQMHRNPSVMKHSFAQVPKVQMQRSSFDRSHGHKTTFDASLLVPVYADEALPGDTFNLNMTAFARLATPIFPIMDNMYLDTHFFAVPMRLVWDNWQKFNGEQTDPGDSTDYLIPQMTAPVGGYTANSINDYFGLPVGVAGVKNSCLWHRAYNLIFNEWFRDQNLVDSVTVKRDDGPDDPALYALLSRGKRHDYFTSSLPFPQKGPAVNIPLGGKAPISGFGLDPASAFPNANVVTKDATTGAAGVLYPFSTDSSVAPAWRMRGTAAGGAGVPDVYADLTQATAATINSLRQAVAVQQIYERDARGGTRYTEIIRAHFGVISPDARLQRPEYLGGGSTPINIAPIPQTSASGAYATTPQGNLAAMGTVLARGHGFTKSFTEHCLIIGICSVRADLTYQQGLNRMWSRRTRFDFYWPALSAIGEQAVLQKEIFSDGVALNDDKIFGYQERYAEYRYKPSIITGEFRSSYPQSLDSWHLSQDFATAPVLDATFIQENVPVDRVIAVPSEPHFLMDTYFSLRCARPMPVYSVPGLTRF